MIYTSRYILDKFQNAKTEEELISCLKSEQKGENDIDNLLKAFSDLRLKLAENMRLDNVLFLFGNGTSLYAGSQDTREFKLENYKEKYQELSSVIAEVETLSGIEEQLNALIIVCAYYHLLKDCVKEPLVAELINDVKKSLINDFVNSVDYHKLFLHEIFLLKLRAFDCLKRTSIYTPNYDLSFEYSLDKLSIEYNDGFSGFVNRVFNPQTLQEDKTLLVKIHGSVNWVEDKGRVKEFQPKFCDGKVIIEDTAPVLIYPTSNKLYQTYSTPYSELMRHMLDRMMMGKNVIVVIGYKYGDSHINEIFLKALENPNNIFYFFVYDSKEKCEFIKQIEQLSDSMPNLNVFEGKVLADFQVFVQYILPSTPEKAEKEKAIELLQKVFLNHEDE